jgi:5-deoxy-glucuronate isomerase
MTNREPHAGTGGTRMFTTGDSEWIVLPLNGGCIVDIENEKYQLLGRDDVFSGVTDFAYVPREARAQIASGAGGRFALAGAKCERRLPARYGSAPEVPVEESELEGIHYFESTEGYR